MRPKKQQWRLGVSLLVGLLFVSFAGGEGRNLLLQKRVLAFILFPLITLFGVFLGSVPAWGDPVTFLLKWGSYGSGDGQFGSPRSLALDSAGNVYVVDRLFDNVQKFTIVPVASSCPAGTTPITSIGSGGKACLIIKFASTGTGGGGQILNSRGIAIDSTGNIYVSDTGNNRIQKFVVVPIGSLCPSGTTEVAASALERACFVTMWGSSFGNPGNGDGQFNGNGHVAVDGLGNLYVSDANGIQKSTFSDSCPPGTAQVIATVCFVVRWSGGAPAVHYSSGIVYDTKDGSGVQKLTLIPAVSICPPSTTEIGTSPAERVCRVTSWGSLGTAEGQFNIARGIAVDEMSNVYIADRFNHRVQKFDSNGNFLLMWGWGVKDGSNVFQVCMSSCQSGIAGDGDGQFNQPWDAEIDAAANIYTGQGGDESTNTRVQKFTQGASPPTAGTIIVKKITNPNPDPTDTSFDYTAGGGLSPTSFSLKNGEMQTFENVASGSGYSITEAVPSGWELTSAVCDDGSDPSDIDVSPDETVTCTFTNTGKPAIAATKEASNAITGSLTVFEAGNTIKYTVVLTNTGGATLNDEAGPEFTDTISDLLLMPNAGATATSGVITYSHSTRTYSWNGSIPVGESVTLTFSVRTPMRMEGTRRFCNQGTAKDGAGGTVLTIDLTPLPGAPGTQTCVDVVGRSDIGFPLTLKGIEALLVGDTMHFMALGTGIEKINVQVFSLTGKRVHTSGWVANGHEWRLEDRTGRKLANGVYLYVMSVRGYDERSVKTQVKKLIIGR